MKELSLFLGSGKNEIYLDGFVRSKINSSIKIKNASIYWNFKNITEGLNNNNVITAVPNRVVFGEGYWDFRMIAEKLAGSGIELERIKHNNKCTLLSKNSDIILNRFGILLGFPDHQVVKKGVKITSPSAVDVNLGLRYVTVECNHVDSEKNYDRDGKRSKIVAMFPVTTEQSLNNSVTHYGDLQFEAPIVNGDHNLFEFTVGTNVLKNPGRGKRDDLEIIMRIHLTE